MFSSCGWRNTAVALFLLLTAGVSGAPQLTALLPRHSAIAAGADFAALCTHKQSAVSFSSLQKLMLRQQLDLQEVVYSCDARCRRSSSLFRFSGEKDTAILQKLLPDGVALDFQCDDPGVYCLNGKPGDRGLIRAVFFAGGIAGLYSGYSRREPFRLDCRGVPEELKKQIPGRETLCWVAGKPGFTYEPLNWVVSFEAFMENDLEGELLLHGRIVFRNAENAATAGSFIPAALAMLLQRYFGIFPLQTLAAVNALEITRKQETLFFSGKEVSGFLNIAAEIIAQRVKIPEKVK